MFGYLEIKGNAYLPKDDLRTLKETLKSDRYCKNSRSFNEVFAKEKGNCSYQKKRIRQSQMLI